MGLTLSRSIYCFVYQILQLVLLDLHDVCASVWRHSVVNTKSCALSMLWEGRSPEGNVFKPPEHGRWALVLRTLHCWTQRSHFCECSTERREVAMRSKNQKLWCEDSCKDFGQEVCQNKPPTSSDQYQPWRSTLGGPNSPKANMSQHYDMRVCSQNHLGRSLGFFLAYKEFKCKQKHQMRACPPQNWRGTKN